MNDDNTRDPLQLRLDRRSEKIMYIIAGCNGAGKTTAFRRSLYESLGRPEFINSDEIARSLCPEDVDSVQVSAGRFIRDYADFADKYGISDYKALGEK